MTFDLQLSISKNAILDKLWKLARENSLGETHEEVNSVFKKIVLGKICFVIEEDRLLVYGNIFPQNKVTLLRRTATSEWLADSNFKNKFSSELIVHLNETISSTTPNQKLMPLY